MSGQTDEAAAVPVSIQALVKELTDEVTTTCSDITCCVLINLFKLVSDIQQHIECFTVTKMALGAIQCTPERESSRLYFT